MPMFTVNCGAWSCLNSNIDNRTFEQKLAFCITMAVFKIIDYTFLFHNLKSVNGMESISAPFAVYSRRLDRNKRTENII